MPLVGLFFTGDSCTPSFVLECTTANQSCKGKGSPTTEYISTAQDYQLLSRALNNMMIGACTGTSAGLLGLFGL